MTNQAILHTFTEDDTRALIDLSIVDPANGNAAVDLTSFTLTLYARGLRDTTVIGPIAGVIQGSATAGICRFDFETVCAHGADRYQCQVNLKDGSDDEQRSEDFYIQVKEKIA